MPLEEVKVGTGRKLYDKTFGTDQEKATKSIAVLTIGPVGHDALKAIEELEQENKCTGHNCPLRYAFLEANRRKHTRRGGTELLRSHHRGRRNEERRTWNSRYGMAERA